MTEEQIYEMTVEAGKHADRAYAQAWNDGDQHGSWQYFRDMKFAELVRSATKEEDARICADLENPSIASCASVDVLDAWANGTFDCEVAIRASK